MASVSRRVDTAIGDAAREALVERLIAGLLDNVVQPNRRRWGQGCILGSWVGSAYGGGQP
jgi:hypothetical protein